MAYTFITIASLHYVSIKNYFIAVLFYFYCSCASGLRHADSRWQSLSSASSVLVTVSDYQYQLCYKEAPKCRPVMQVGVTARRARVDAFTINKPY